MFTWLHTFFLIAFLIFAAGCGGSSVEVVSEEQEKSFLRGKRYEREGNHSEALSAFLKVIARREEAADSHLEAGRIFHNHIKDPISAIYHFRKYLEIRPDSVQAGLVRQLIETSKKEFARTLAGHPFENDIDRLDLLELVNQLKLDNRRLREQLAAAAGSPSRADDGMAGEESQTLGDDSLPDSAQSYAGRGQNEPAVAAPSGVAANNAETRPATYIIQPGDNLSKISAQVYGSPDRWRDIFQANRDKLTHPDDLRVGVELKIP